MKEYLYVMLLQKRKCNLFPVSYQTGKGPSSVSLEIKKHEVFIRTILYYTFHVRAHQVLNTLSVVAKITIETCPCSPPNLSKWLVTVMMHMCKRENHQVSRTGSRFLPCLQMPLYWSQKEDAVSGPETLLKYIQKCVTGKAAHVQEGSSKESLSVNSLDSLQSQSMYNALKDQNCSTCQKMKFTDAS